MPDPHSDLSLDAATREILQQHGFEAEVFRRLREKLKQSGADPATNRIRETVEVPVTPMSYLSHPWAAMHAGRGRSSV